MSQNCERPIDSFPAEFSKSVNSLCPLSFPLLLAIFRRMIGDWVEVEAPANIALIKYWGKRDEELILPLNDSVSLSVDSLCARTRVELIQGRGNDSVSINDKPVDRISGSRFEKCFDEARRLLRKRKENNEHGLPNFSFKVDSSTTFPVAAGLASSAAGFAAIAFALGKLFHFSEADVSRIARIGSGSACRSVAEGLVQWHSGTDSSGMDCFSESLFPQSYWSDLRAIILVLNANEKETGSTIGMRNTAKTSELLKHRVEIVVPSRVKSLIEAYREKNFEKLAKITMADSNQFHAVCMDTFPPLRYMTDSSWEIIRVVNEFNKNGIRAAYTFDAGPNACIFLEEENITPFLESLSSISSKIAESLQSQGINFNPSKLLDGSKLESIIVSKVGMGPRTIASKKVI